MMYSVLLVLALAAQGYARPNCFFACDYPAGQTQQPSFQAPGFPAPSFPAANGNIVQPHNPSVDVFGPAYRPGAAQPPHIENFQPSPAGSHVSFNHESQSSQKTSISGTYHYPAPSPPISEPIRYQPVQYQPVQYQPVQYQPIQKPCRVYSDCS